MFGAELCEIAAVCEEYIHNSQRVFVHEYVVFALFSILMLDSLAEVYGDVCIASQSPFFYVYTPGISFHLVAILFVRRLIRQSSRGV